MHVPPRAGSHVGLVLGKEKPSRDIRSGSALAWPSSFAACTAAYDVWQSPTPDNGFTGKQFQFRHFQDQKRKSVSTEGAEDNEKAARNGLYRPIQGEEFTADGFGIKGVTMSPRQANVSSNINNN